MNSFDSFDILSIFITDEARCMIQKYVQLFIFLFHYVLPLKWSRLKSVLLRVNYFPYVYHIRWHPMLIARNN